jgi:sugar transferase (PEP-CTERM/EpsH1 system associated)
MNVLVLTHRLPYAPNRGDRIRAFHVIRQLANHANVRLVSLTHDRAEAAEAVSLERMGVRVWTAHVPRARNFARAVPSLLTDTPLTHTLLDSPEMSGAIAGALDGWRPDVVLAYCSGVAPVALAEPLAGIPLVVDFVDLDSAKWRSLSKSSAPPRSWIFAREARCLSRFETDVARIARETTVVNERERDALLAICPDARVEVVANGVECDRLQPFQPPASEPSVVFSGVFNYAPNVEGALWLAQEVWPRVRAVMPAARLTLAGAHPVRSIRRLGGNDHSIEVTGEVPDIRRYLWRAAVSVAPLLTARGVQNKVLEAVAAGLPAVVTPAVWDGLPAEVLPA